MTGLLASLVFLLPFALFLSHSGGSFTLLPPGAVFYQLLGVAFPEEVYFRGFLQEKTGNTFRGLFTVSVLFSLIHLPRFIFAGDATSLLTFFPSLVMGFLYRRTSNVLPSTLFHFLSNTVLLGFCDIL
ncbi:MAG: CPBP family intramembrane metalloprotease [Nitrospirae bacterium]|nr:CPBP family intramembrane metalloprotease [Nitrospirota bacterium]